MGSRVISLGVAYAGATMPANEVKIQTIPTDITDQPNTKLWINLAYAKASNGS
jgi:hypothetical protein